MNRFSIVVPFMGDLNAFEDTLASVLRYQPHASQVIVAHDGTFEDRYGVADEVTVVQSEKRAQLIRLFNCGLRAADGEFVALIRPGIELDENWQISVLDAFENDRVASVTPLIVTPRKANSIVAAGVQKGLGFRRTLVGAESRVAPRTLRKLKPLGPTSWAAFYRRSAIDLVGTPDESLDASFLDLDLALGFRALGLRCQLASECVCTIERPIPLQRESMEPHGRSAQRAFLRHQGESSFGTTLKTAVIELVQAPLKPWLMKQALERFQARRFRDIDKSYARRIRERKSTATVEQIVPISAFQAPSVPEWEQRRAA